MHAEGFFTCFQGAQSCSEEQTTCSTWHAPLLEKRDPLRLWYRRASHRLQPAARSHIKEEAMLRAQSDRSFL